MKESGQNGKTTAEAVQIEADETEKKDAEKEGSSSDINDVFTADSEDEGDEEDILAACINKGMQTNRYLNFYLCMLFNILEIFYVLNFQS